MMVSLLAEPLLLAWTILPTTTLSNFILDRLQLLIIYIYGQADGSCPGHTRSADSKDAVDRIKTRLGDCQRHPANLTRDSADPARLTVSRPSSPRATGLDQIRMAADRRRPHGQVLLAHDCGPSATRKGVG